MSCCGDRRRAATRSTHQRMAQRPSSSPIAVLRNPVSVGFVAAGPVVVRGATTGLTYAFPAGGGALQVDERDLDALLGSGMFRRA
ncbi:MAG: hypothetical protein ACT4P7_00070 [Gemmatimonadaceae bacterium]